MPNDDNIPAANPNSLKPLLVCLPATKGKHWAGGSHFDSIGPLAFFNKVTLGQQARKRKKRRDITYGWKHLPFEALNAMEV